MSFQDFIRADSLLQYFRRKSGVPVISDSHRNQVLGKCPFQRDGRCTLSPDGFPCTGRWYITCTVYLKNRGKL